MSARRVRMPDQKVFVGLVVAALVVFYGVFLIWPLFWALRISVSNWDVFRNVYQFAGLKHYLRAFKDPIFRISLRNTFYYATLAVPSGLVVATALALLIHRSGRLRPPFSMAYFLPVVTSVIATSILWRWAYQPHYGLFNGLLTAIGLPKLDWLLSPRLVMPCLVLYATWKGIGFTVIILLAGLDSIDSTFYEAAQVDGANGWQTFWRITLPLLRPTLVFVLVTGVIGALQVFGPVFVMTEGPGGPLHASRVLVLYQYEMAFKSHQWPYGTAMAFISFVIIMALTLLQLRFLRRRWDY